MNDSQNENDSADLIKKNAMQVESDKMSVWLTWKDISTQKDFDQRGWLDVQKKWSIWESSYNEADKKKNQ